MSAIEIMAAGDEDGWGDYDGLCTLFNLQIGNDAQKQNFRFVPSTSSFTTWLPLYERCFILVNSSSKYPLWPTTLDKCAEESGVGTYEGTQNIGFNGSFNRPSYTEFEGETLDLGSSLQPADLFGQSYFGVSGVAGLDWVSLQLAGNDSWYQALNHTPIFGLDTVLYMLPTLGLGFGQYVSGLGPAYTSFMNTVSDTFVIPSRSWGYTAGAHYEPPNSGTHGSLVLGGYDRGRIQAKSTATFGISNQTNELLVNVAAININWNDEPPASSPANVFPAVIDSTLPYMELPTQVCDFFAEKFNLTEDNGTNIYFANSGIADTNSRRTSSISFVLQDAYHGSGQTTITFPYDAFNSTLHWSWGNSEPRIIFPMRKMNKTAVLGRAFLQEAYLFANYEPDNMTLQLSQTVHDNPSSNIVSVYSSRHVVLSPSRKLKGGAIAGIVIGVVAIVALVALALWWFVRHRKNKKKEAAVEDTVAEKDGTSATVKHTEGDPDIWPKGAYGAVEVDAVSPSVASSARPGHRRLGSNVSELSSDSEHQKNHTLMGTLHEMPDNPSAAELEGSHRWSNGNDPPSQDSVSPSAQSTPPPKLQSSPASENSLHLPS